MRWFQSSKNQHQKNSNDVNKPGGPTLGIQELQIYLTQEAMDSFARPDKETDKII